MPASDPGATRVSFPLDPGQVPPVLRPALPIEARDYPQFWRAPRYRWWKGLLAAAMGGVLFLIASTILSFVGWGIDGVDWSVLAHGEIPPVGPGFFLANNLGLVLCVPFAMLAAWACVQQSPRWLSSVVGGIRWRWLFLVLGALAPLWVLVVGTQTLLGSWGEMSWREYSVLMIVGVLVTTPLQAAGEEYLVRGLFTRAIASWFRPRWLAFGASAIITALIFMSMHGAGDPWLNAYYVTFGLTASWVTWRSGGLEAAVAIHALNNVVAEATLPFVDFSSMFDRQAGAGDASVLINMGLLIVAAVIVEALMRWKRPVTQGDPGKAAWQQLTARAAGFEAGPIDQPRTW